MARNPFLPNNEENHSNSQQSSGKIVLKPAGVGAYKVCGPDGFEFSFDIVVDNIKIMVSGLSESSEGLQDGTNEQTVPGFGTSTPSAPGFGASATATPGFGTPTPSAPGFGASAPAAPGFGTPSASSAPGFGTPSASSAP